MTGCVREDPPPQQLELFWSPNKLHLPKLPLLDWWPSRVAKLQPIQLCLILLDTSRTQNSRNFCLASHSACCEAHLESKYLLAMVESGRWKVWKSNEWKKPQWISYWLFAEIPKGEPPSTPCIKVIWKGHLVTRARVFSVVVCIMWIPCQGTSIWTANYSKDFPFSGMFLLVRPAPLKIFLNLPFSLV